MIRLVIAILLLLSSLLVVYKAPMHFLWLLAVVITNYPWLFILLCMAVFISAFWAAKYKLLVMFVSLAALAIYTLPVVYIYKKSTRVKTTLAKSFHGTKHINRQPFNFFTMFSGLTIKQVTPQAMVYKTTEGQGLSLDYYAADSVGTAPVIVVVHGGSWESGDNKQFIDFNSYFANRGYNVAAINYRLAPAYQSPAPMEDAHDAIQYLKANAQGLHIDTNNIVLLGRSAGAQVALMAAYNANIPGLKGVVDFYGPADMVWGGQAKTNRLMLNTDKIYKDYFGGVYSEVPQNFKANSACEYVHAGTPPTLIIHGETDAMVSHIHSEHLDDRLSAYNIPHYFLSMQYATHACDYNINSPCGQLTTYAVEGFIYSVTHK